VGWVIGRLRFLHRRELPEQRDALAVRALLQRHLFVGG
jgi:hypothetical protein